MPSPEKIKVVIDRSKWRTGKCSNNRTGRGATNLLNTEGYMCCLGFCCKASDVKSEYLLRIGTPNQVVNARRGSSRQHVLSLRGIRELTEICGHGGDSSKVYALSNTLTDSAMKINDNSDTTPREKEQQLLELFKDSVFELEFTGEYEKPFFVLTQSKDEDSKSQEKV